MSCLGKAERSPYRRNHLYHCEISSCDNNVSSDIGHRPKAKSIGTRSAPASHRYSSLDNTLAVISNVAKGYTLYCSLNWNQESITLTCKGSPGATWP